MIFLSSKPRFSSRLMELSILFLLFQMSCIRLLECLPVLVQRLQQSMHKIPGDSDIVVKNSVSNQWLHDLMYWGKSTLVVVVRYWKQTVLSLLDILKVSCDDKTSSIMAIKKLIHSGIFLLVYSSLVSVFCYCFLSRQI